MTRREMVSRLLVAGTLAVLIVGADERSATAGLGRGGGIATSGVFRGGSPFACFVVNVNPVNPVTVEIEVVNDDGSSALLQTQTILPRHIGGVDHQPTGKPAAWCRFAVRSGGDNTDLRGSYCVLADSGLCDAVGDAR